LLTIKDEAVIDDATILFAEISVNCDALDALILVVVIPPSKVELDV
jgi:hypothetical protein